MHFLQLFKHLIIVCFFALLSLPAEASTGLHNEQGADQIINQLYHSLSNKPTLDMPARIAMISAEFLGKPYLLGALGEGMQSDYDQFPLYRTDAFDCETYVDTVLALALANNLEHFKRRINQVRYRDGHVSFIDRNHFTCLDWNKNNQHQGFVKDITTTVRNERNQAVVHFARALIDKPAWYSHQTVASIRLRQVNSLEQKKRLTSLKEEGNHLPRATSIIPYIPFTVLFDRTGKENTYLFNQIPHGSIIEIVRPNWDLSKEIGTHLNISHLGFAIWEKGTLLFRAASSTHSQVLDVPLIPYLRSALQSPTIKGINIQIVLTPVVSSNPSGR